MLLTKECDYAMRVIRVLKSGEKRSVKQICHEEDMPEPFTYKILKKLEKAEIVKAIRGAQGGYVLETPIEKLHLMDIIRVIDEDFGITHCTKNNCDCTRDCNDHPCMVHKEFERIQSLLISELENKTLVEIL